MELSRALLSLRVGGTANPNRLLAARAILEDPEKEGPPNSTELKAVWGIMKKRAMQSGTAAYRIGQTFHGSGNAGAPSIATSEVPLLPCAGVPRTGYEKFMKRPSIKGEGEPIRSAEGIDIAARYLVYNLFEATRGAQQEWRALREFCEEEEIVARAMERGWVVVFIHRRGAKGTIPVVTLTDKGRRMARRRLH